MIRTLIVDDEPPARALVREYLADLPQIDVVGECANGREAIAAINQKAPDLVFLDIQMPGLSGFDILPRLDVMPRIIFATAYDEYAIQAFETGAIDYLLKPYTRGRLRKAVERVLAQQQDPSHLQTILEAATPRPVYPERLLVRTGDKIVPVAVADLVWAEAAGDYTTLHTTKNSVLCSLGLGALAKRLDPQRFARVHRSALIALDAVRHFASDGEGGYWATLVTNHRVRVSRSYAGHVRDQIV